MSSIQPGSPPPPPPPCHTTSPLVLTPPFPSPPRRVIDQFSQEFLDGFVSLLSRRFGTRRIKANAVYQEYIQERHHLHMNATRWVTLTEFVKHLGKEGIVHVDENEKGFFISWVDNSPAALKRQAALQKLERQKMDDEGRQRRYLREQIAKAKREEASGTGGGEKQGGEEVGLLRREEGEGKVKLGISLGGGGSGSSSSAPKAEGNEKAGSSSSPAASSSSTSAAAPSTAKPAFSFGTTAAPAPFRLGANPLKGGASTATKPPAATNAFKSASSVSSSSSSSSSAKRSEPRTMAEKIMLEEEERRKRKMSGPMPSAGAGAGGAMKRIRM